MEEVPWRPSLIIAQSFNVEPWRNIVDFNAELIEVPLGTISDSLQGFAFLNVDGTYTAFLGADVTLDEYGYPSFFATVELISRRSTLDQFSTIYATVEGSYAASAVYHSYQDGGDDFISYILNGDDTVEIGSPASLGALSESPLIETHFGDDVVNGSIYDDTIYAGPGNDEVHGDDGRRYDLWRRRRGPTFRRPRQCSVTSFVRQTTARHRSAVGDWCRRRIEGGSGRRQLCRGRRYGRQTIPSKAGCWQRQPDSAAADGVDDQRSRARMATTRPSTAAIEGRHYCYGGAGADHHRRRCAAVTSFGVDGG